MIQQPLRQYRGVAQFLVFYSIFVWFVLSVGGFVRNMQAGLACPDWPLCFGVYFPDIANQQIFAEYFHRVLAALLGIFLLGLAFYAVLFRKDVKKLIGRLIVLSIIIYFSQAILGGLTVLLALKSEVVTLHLIFGTLYFAIVLIMTLRCFRPPAPVKRKEPTNTWRWGIAALAAVFLQMVLGGMVSSNVAGLACPDFPKCLGQWWPGLSGLVGLHFLHRLGAVVTFIVVVAFVVRIFINRKLPRHILTKGWLVLFALFLQIALGISNVLLAIPVSIGVAHLAVAQLLFALVLITTYEIRHFQLH